ncbi:Coiled-coil domain-containing protein, partial [Pseudolycoriella hygida]
MLGYGPGQLPPQQRAMDLEGQPIRGYQQVNQGPLFDEDPGIMSEVETASTGFRRGGKQRSSLPVVRTPSKTLERPLGLVFLQYRSETKRALLPNEITSIDTVRALFVRSFPRQLTMVYLEGPNVKIYIHDASKDMFYELEDVRSHLREIRDRSVLRLFESNEVTAPQVLPGGPGVPQPLPSNGGHWDQDQSYFSEPEFDSEYQHQHIHKGKV